MMNRQASEEEAGRRAGRSTTGIFNIGVHLDKIQPMKQHNDSLSGIAFLAIRKIASIRPFLSDSSTAKLVSSMITSRLDCCNVTFAGVANE